ncbi:hypothetical protein Tdes44962_MAKER09832 [Teratosphaeria destructans]|uniref:G-protein coupled receptors family 2 profile 2 domain-containing protein n=1 Tax=Teratosphaeria destructans TaxID=418781 RepID=A0A9W7SR80_9PEZI|nr:hypothetical protein Tdes44962_MAKER09832 [Teratosphaeria destructans]
MGNETDYTGACLAPFLDASLFPDEGGYIRGRFCAPISQLEGNPTCCVPCPATDWIYRDSFLTYATIAEWLNVLGLILLIFLLVSYVLLPVQQTRSHYLSTCLIVSVACIALGFTIPLGANPEQCFNEITPNDMYSSTECAFSGAFIVAGGLSAIVWISIRALSMNLQICWDIVPGPKFFYVSQALGWGISAALFTATMTKTGVSFRFGQACHVNHYGSMADFWGPLLGFAGASAILQLTTLIYCIHVYLKNLWADESHLSAGASDSAGLPSYQGSVRAQTAKAVFQRLKKVLWLQWRGICIVTIILVDVVFFATVFVYMDGEQHNLLKYWTKVEPWLICLAQHPNSKGVPSSCVELIGSVLVNEATVAAVLLLLSLAGLEVFFVLARPALFTAWSEYVQSKVWPRKQEFVSLDARQPETTSKSGAASEVLQYNHVRGHQKTTFEMQPPSLDMKSPATSTVLSSPETAHRNPDPRPGSPDISQNPTRATSPNLHSNARDSPPAPAYHHDPASLTTQLGDYFDQSHAYHQLQRRGFIRDPSSESSRQGRVSPLVESGWGRRPDSRDHERRYRPACGSFSAPRPPSRPSSQKSATVAEASQGREGPALYPPSEISEDGSLSGLEPCSQSLDSRLGRRR